MMLAASALVPNQKGFALLIVLWSLVFISFLITHLTVASHTEAGIALNIRRHAIQQAQVDGAIFEAVFHMRSSGSAHWEADGSPHMLQQPGATIMLTMHDEATKINPNTASTDLLQAFFIAEGVGAGQATALAASVADWRDPGNTPRPFGAKAVQYEAAGRAYTQPGTPFRSFDELGFVLGMNTDLLKRSIPHLTLYATDGPIETAQDLVVARALKRVQAAGTAMPDLQTYHTIDIVSIKAVSTGADAITATRFAIIGFEHQKHGERVRVLDWSS